MNENMKTNIGVIIRSNRPQRFARRAWLALLGQLFMLAGGAVHATVPAAASAARQDAAFDALLKLMRERLLLMHEVAKWKWNEGKPITDAGRERKLFAEFERRGTAYGLTPEFIRAFLAGQIKAAKLIQEADFNAWKRSGRGKFSDARDLTNDLRPQLDKLSDQILTQLAKVAPLLGDEETKTNVARQAKSVIRGDGIDDEVRTVAIHSLLNASAGAPIDPPRLRLRSGPRPMSITAPPRCNPAMPRDAASARSLQKPLKIRVRVIDVANSSTNRSEKARREVSFIRTRSARLTTRN